MTWTAAIIVSAKRVSLVETVIAQAIIDCQPDQFLVVGEMTAGPWEYLHVPRMMGDTRDALIKRDVAALACTSDWIAYFCDDHKPAPDFGEQVLALLSHGCAFGATAAYDVFVPARYAGQPGDHYGERLNNGEAVEELPLPGQWRDTAIGHYCGGHAGVYRLDLIRRMPWTAGPHHREWDLLNSRRHIDAGAKYCWTDQLKVWDVEPGATPWL